MVLVERTQRRRPEPQIVVDAGGHGAVGDDADRIPLPVDHGLAAVDRAEPAIAQELHRLAEHGAAPPLRADLDDPVVAPGRLDHPPAFDDVVADGLFDVDVLARLAGQDRHERVPVIGRGDGDRVDVAIVEHPPEIGLGLRVAAPSFLHEGQRGLEMPFVDIHDVGDADVLDPGKVLVVILPAAAGGPGRMALVVAAEADDRDVDGLVRARCA